jgi:hypothetical protein
MGKCDTDPYSGRPAEHSFESWEAREEGGFIIYTRGARVGHLEPFSRRWQERKCKECGFVDASAMLGSVDILGLVPR